MRWCAASVIGGHDFTSFCKSAAEVEHYRCVVQAATWEADEFLLRFTIRADRFLHGMVRALVGTMVDVGRGYRSVPDFVALLDARERTLAGPAAPPCGLVLESVRY
jgi:tRNA pseudouridine38-40 synthase